MHLGVDVTRVKLVVYVSASVLTGLAVSVSGAIGYVGLLVPHVMRMLFGSDYRVLIPTSALGGAIAIVVADTLARTVVAPTELPVGAMTAMAGAPVFIYLAAPEAGVSGTASLTDARPDSDGAATLRTCASTWSKPATPTRPASRPRRSSRCEATTFQAREREFVAILGPNASGKSTLLRLISGAIAPLSGRVELDGFETCHLDARTRAQRIAMVQQESPLVFPMRAGDYVLQGRHPHGRSLWFEKDEDFAIAESALAQVGAEHLRDRWMHEISGGEKQRVVLARALAQQPLVLLLDEPTLASRYRRAGRSALPPAPPGRRESLHRDRRHPRARVWPPNSPIRSCCCTAANACAWARPPRSISANCSSKSSRRRSKIELGPDGPPARD